MGTIPGGSWASNTVKWSLYHSLTERMISSANFGVYRFSTRIFNIKIWLGNTLITIIVHFIIGTIPGGSWASTNAKWSLYHALTKRMVSPANFYVCRFCTRILNNKIWPGNTLLTLTLLTIISAFYHGHHSRWVMSHNHCIMVPMPFSYWENGFSSNFLQM